MYDDIPEPINFKICQPIPQEWHIKLNEIYERCQTHILEFAFHANYGDFVCDQIWCETQEDQQWILDKLLPYYGIDYEEVAELDYSNAVTESSRSGAFTEGFTPPYPKNSINFTRFVAGKAAIMQHNAGVDHVLCKLNIPVKNIESGTCRWIETAEGWNYRDNTAMLLNVQKDHTVDGLEELTEDRAFLSIALITPFAISIADDKVIRSIHKQK
jgi:hypothetical protein